MSEIQINYDRGSMTVNLQNFFPTSQKKIRKLLEVIRMDPSAKYHIEVIKQHLKKERVRYQNKADKFKSNLDFIIKQEVS